MGGWVVGRAGGGWGWLVGWLGGWLVVETRVSEVDCEIPSGWCRNITDIITQSLYLGAIFIVPRGSHCNGHGK